MVPRYADVQHARGWCTHGAGQAALSLRVVYEGSRCAYSVRTRHGCGKVHFSTQAEADRPWAETERLLQREHDDEGVHAQRPTVSIGMQLCDACSGGRLHAY